MKQSTALDILKSGQNVFLTGSAGSGKTYTLNQYIHYLRARRVPVAVTASTGIAATHMSGITIHSWSGIGIKSEMDEKDLHKISRNKKRQEKLKDTAVLIIDEISMLHSKQLNLVNGVLKHVRESDEAFGGIQVVLAGDFFQLPPVGAKHESNRDKFAFMSQSWLEADFNICYLTEQHRQCDDTDNTSLSLNDILNQIRASQVTHQAVNTLKDTINNQINDNRTQLYTHNYSVDKINIAELTKLTNPERLFVSEGLGDDKLVEMLKKGVRTSDELLLKKGSKVMFIKNISELNVFNGTIGEIVDFRKIDSEAAVNKQDTTVKTSSDDDNDDNETGSSQVFIEYPVVRLNSGRQVIASPEEWSVEDEMGEILASYSQIPLCLAWAITIHKSQGMTLDAAEIDLSNTFEMGQGYVALSRLKELSGLKLLGINETSLRLDPLARGADKRFMELSTRMADEIAQIEPEQLQKVHNTFVLSAGGSLNQQWIDNYEERQKKRTIANKQNSHKKTQGANDVTTLDKTKALIEEGLSISEIAQERELAQSTIMKHVQKIRKENQDTLRCTHLQPSDKIMALVAEAKDSITLARDPHDFDEHGNIKLRPLHEYLKGELAYNTIRLALIFLDD